MPLVQCVYYVWCERCVGFSTGSMVQYTTVYVLYLQLKFWIFKNWRHSGTVFVLRVVRAMRRIRIPKYDEFEWSKKSQFEYNKCVQMWLQFAMFLWVKFDCWLMWWLQCNQRLIVMSATWLIFCFVCVWESVQYLHMSECEVLLGGKYRNYCLARMQAIVLEFSFLEKITTGTQ